MDKGKILDTKELDRHLWKTYRLRRRDFEFGLRNVGSFFVSIKLKKRKKEYQTRISELEAAKRKILKNIVNFLNRTGLWAEITDISPENRLVSHEGTVSYLKQHFGLAPYFEKIDNKIRFYRRVIVLLDGFRIETEGKKKSVKLSTLIVLVWFYTMRDADKKVTKTQKFRDISRLLTWFSTHKPELMNELFGTQVVLDDTAIKANYDRYIKNPSASRRAYKEIAFLIDEERFYPPD
jgi:hypothetical protein